MPKPSFRPAPGVSELRDPAWGESPVRDECWVNANDEEEARGMASARFQDARSTVPGHASAPSPWRDTRLVAVTQSEQTPAGMTIPYGTVVAGPQA